MPLTPKNRKEQWLEGLVQHETALTPKNRPEAWMKEIIDASGGGGIDLGITGASVGEYAKIKTVDANGVPTAWESGSGGGGGGGVLVVNFNRDTGALDKTWNEINSASFAVVKLINATPPIISTGIVCQTRINDGTEYKVVAYLPSEGDTAGFVTSSADGYPVMQTP